MSPLYGVRLAHGFYTELFADPARFESTLLSVFNSSAGSKPVSLHFRFIWTLASGMVVDFVCVEA